MIEAPMTDATLEVDENPWPVGDSCWMEEDAGTMPRERTRNLMQAGAFLRELSANTTLPKAVRAEAYRPPD